MRKNGKKKVIILVLGIIFAITIVSTYIFRDDQLKNDDNVDIRDEISLKRPKKSGIYSEPFIHIDGNWSTATTYDWCYGKGTLNEPYIIENVTIDASSSPTGSGIFINNSKNDYFIIRNCNITNAGSGSQDAGIKLENTCNGSLINNNCSDNGKDGILLWNNCDNNTITKNTANENAVYGIHLSSYCDDNIISGNTANENWEGIYLHSYCDDNTITENTANENAVYGIHLSSYCDDNTISGNTANENWLSGIYLYSYCDDNTISGNTANNNIEYGIYLRNYCDDNTISGNTENENWLSGIYLFSYCDDNTISGNTANNNNEYGIYLRNYCDDNTISGNIANENWLSGIYLYSYCDDNTISENTANNSIALRQDNGILLKDYCNNNTISGNTANNNNEYGIYLWNYCDDNIILGNTANENDDYGIYLRSYCDKNIISGNTVYNNTNFGIFLWNYCDKNTISGNLISINEKGIELYSSRYNLIFSNCILNNSLNNAIDDAGTNNWDNGTLGNYWSNYTGIDADQDGIGDTAFGVPGTSNSIDNKPLMKDNLFILNLPDDVTYDYGTEGHRISWTIINTFTTSISFTIFRDGISIKTGNLNPYVSHIAINVDGLEVGSHNFTIEIYDGSGGMVRDIVWVIVTPIHFLCMDTIEQRYSENWFNITFYIYNELGQSLSTATMTAWWNGIEVSQGKIIFLGGGLYRVSLTPITVAPDEDPILLNMTISASGYQDKYYELYLAVEQVEPEDHVLCVDIVDQFYSENWFNITFYIYDELGQSVSTAAMTVWWNGIEVSQDKIVFLGGGLYRVSLTPITVAPDEDPILLNMTISASGYQDKYYETYLAVDPQVIDKEAIIQATVDFKPDTLNLKSNGKWVTVYIELPDGYNVDEIDIGSILLNGIIEWADSSPTNIGDYDNDGIPDLMVKFSRMEVQAILETGESVEIIISGELIDGTKFVGTDTIRVIQNSSGKKSENDQILSADNTFILGGVISLTSVISILSTILYMKRKNLNSLIASKKRD